MVRRPQALAAFLLLLAALLYLTYWIFFRGETVQVVEPEARIEAACPDPLVPEPRFSDVSGDDVRALAIACTVWWGIVGGTEGGEFVPDAPVTRGQLATLLARTIQATDAELPDEAPDVFTDDDGTPHEPAIGALAAEGIITGVSDERFGIGEPVDRAQAATFLARTYEFVLGEPPPEGEDAYRDDDGGVHEDAINAMTAAGIASGRGDDTFAPQQAVTRADIATFLARLLDRFVREEVAELPT